MIIDKNVLKLVNLISNTSYPNEYLKELIQILSQNCNSENKYINYKNTQPILSEKYKLYPIEKGFAVAIDILHDENKLIDYWHEYGFVVGKNVVSNSDCENAIKSILNYLSLFNMSFEKPNTWLTDSNNTPIISRGFFEVYHDNALAQLRQSLKLYLHYTVLWKTPFLWTSFDRLGVKLPQGEESKGLSLHVDQNPFVHPNFQTIQGVVALSDCPIERGTFVAVPQSIKDFSSYQEHLTPGYIGEYVPLIPESSIYEKMFKNQQAIPLKKGNIVSWDSRTTHANSDNCSKENRYVAYISTGLAKSKNIESMFHNV